MLKFDVNKTVQYWLEGANAEKSGIEIPPKILKRLARFMEFHFEARYPKQQKKFYEKYTKQFTVKKMEEIREVFKWLTEKLETE